MAEVKARNRSSRNKKKGLSGGGILKVKSLLKKLQKVVLLLVGKNNKPSSSSSIISVAEDVKKGHFAVIVIAVEGPKRFLVPLSCLKNPAFLSLLERAAEEYGFDQHGAITIPCNPSDLETLLAHHQLEEEEDDKS
ncbi:hypothetical protein PIB30_046364 [Stylosanthes scabra]|uniref:Uncharacterized protein n=1 Tax=Stylosanthes scabra TaxID=79078 RepID=A0ABU6ZF70_9FABA|nr:hypothetical protein [Stylosanthes scabra]